MCGSCSTTSKFFLSSNDNVKLCFALMSVSNDSWISQYITCLSRSSSFHAASTLVATTDVDGVFNKFVTKGGVSTLEFNKLIVNIALECRFMPKSPIKSTGTWFRRYVIFEICKKSWQGNFQARFAFLPKSTSSKLCVNKIRALYVEMPTKS